MTCDISRARTANNPIKVNTNTKPTIFLICLFSCLFPIKDMLCQKLNLVEHCSIVVAIEHFWKLRLGGALTSVC